MLVPYDQELTFCLVLNAAEKTKYQAVPSFQSLLGTEECLGVLADLVNSQPFPPPADYMKGTKITDDATRQIHFKDSAYQAIRSIIRSNPRNAEIFYYTVLKGTLAGFIPPTPLVYIQKQGATDRYKSILPNHPANVIKEMFRSSMKLSYSLEPSIVDQLLAAAKAHGDWYYLKAVRSLCYFDGNIIFQNQRIILPRMKDPELIQSVISHINRDAFKSQWPPSLVCPLIPTPHIG